MTGQQKPRWLSRDLIPLVAAIVVTVLGLVYRGPLIRWFTGGAPESAHSAGSAPSAVAGNLQLSTSLEPDPPREQGNALVLELSDKAGTAIDGAVIAVDISMPAMGSMPPMKTSAEVASAGPGRYRARFDLAMGGTWNVLVTVESASGSMAAEYNLTVGRGGLTPVSASATGDAAGTVPSYEFRDVARTEVERALTAYEQVRAELAGDSIAGLEPNATQLANALRAIQTHDSALPDPLGAALTAGADAADRLGRADTLPSARAAFADASRALVAIVTADASVNDTLHVFECPMTDGYNKWVQSSERLANPYQGAAMLTCGSELDWASASTGSAPAHAHDPSEIHHYTCPMDTWVKSKEPGSCPVCGMDLVPVTTEEMKTGVMRIDHRRRQLIGLRTGVAEMAPMTRQVQAIGKVVYDQTRLADITLKYDGFIERLLVDEPGQRVRKGQTLFTVYSPELYTAQQEYLLALAQRERASTDADRARADTLVEGAAARLRLWDITRAQLADIARRGKPLQYVPILSPAAGYVVEKNVVEGSAIKTGQRLFRLAGLDRIWVEADVYEQDIPFVTVGKPAAITLSHLPGRSFEGKVAFVYPFLDGGTRTTRARIELANRDMSLKPDMYANVALRVDLGERLVIPEAAVIYSGPRRIVFLDIGGDKLRPQQIEVGTKGNGYFEVLSGLKPGDIVVTSGNFLLSAETRLKAATGLW